VTAVGHPVLSPRVPWWALAVLVGVAELTMVHVQVRREAQAISLSEIPLVVALFLATPVDMMSGVVLGAGALYVLYRRQSAIKAVFNVTLRVFGVSLTLVIFQALAGPGQGWGPGAWPAAITAVAAAGAADGVLVLGVVALYEGSMSGHDLRRELLGFPPISAVIGTIGVLAVTALHADVRNGILLLVAGRRPDRGPSRLRGP
jgi:hypothetical protein